MVSLDAIIILFVRSKSTAKKVILDTIYWSFCLIVPGDCQRWLKTELAPWAQTLCDENVAWMRGILNRCDAECGLVSASNFLPTRLIDLGDNDQGGSICLIETSDARLQPSSSYAALSYCWGTEEQAARQLTTTSAVLLQRLDGILFDEMTPVMQDMVKTARALLIRYIWIDALCIVQDDIEDWAHEAERMGSVYANAFVTICAASTSSCLDSFLDRPAAPVRVAFQSSLQPGITGHLNLHSERHPHRVPGSDFDVTRRGKDLRCGAWSLRAWTLQEEELSKRLLYFGARRVHFSCPSRRITEMEPASSDHVPLFSHQLRRYKQGEPDVNILRDWHRLLRSYVDRQSTKSKDRFAAIAGLAKLMAEATKWTYVAGLWKDVLLEELFWYTDQWDDITKQQLFARLIARTPDTYIGPSWSWTHCCYVRFAELNLTRSKNPRSPSYRTVNFRSECHHLEAICASEGASANPYGRLTDSKLRVIGKIIKPEQTWKLMGEWNTHLTMTYGFYVAYCHVDWRMDYENIELDDPGVSLLLLGSDYGPIDFEYRGDRTFDGSEGSPRILKFNEAGEMTEESVRACELPGNRNAHGLLIHPIDGGARYIRVGRFWTTQVGALLPFMERPFEDVEVV